MQTRSDISAKASSDPTLVNIVLEFREAIVKPKSLRKDFEVEFILFDLSRVIHTEPEEEVIE